MVAAPARIEMPERDEVVVHLVSQKKYNLDPGRPWWQKAWFRHVYLPLVRFSFKRMKIASPAAMEPDGTIVLIEQQGIYADEKVALSSCENAFWQVKGIPFNVDLPKESFQYAGHRHPLSIMPDRFRRRVFPLGAVQINQLVEATKRLRKMNQKADA